MKQEKNKSTEVKRRSYQKLLADLQIISFMTLDIYVKDGLALTDFFSESKVTHRVTV